MATVPGRPSGPVDGSPVCLPHEETNGNKTMIDLCTFTGVDDRTDLARVADMAVRHRGLEFGVLFSRTPEDKDARYPALREIERIAVDLSGKARLALHVCGRAVAEFVEGKDDLLSLAAAFGRVQLNFNLSKASFSIEDLDGAIGSFRGSVITQHFPANAALAQSLKSANHHVLFDASGGRGLHAGEPSGPFAGKYTGYAGGYGPETIMTDIASVSAASGEVPVWIDMESRIRTDGYLDLDRCEAVAAALG
jgi:hypothetical protein